MRCLRTEEHRRHGPCAKHGVHRPCTAEERLDAGAIPKSWHFGASAPGGDGGRRARARGPHEAEYAGIRPLRPICGTRGSVRAEAPTALEPTGRDHSGCAASYSGAKAGGLRTPNVGVTRLIAICYGSSPRGPRPPIFWDRTPPTCAQAPRLLFSDPSEAGERPAMPGYTGRSFPGRAGAGGESLPRVRDKAHSPSVGSLAYGGEGGIRTRGTGCPVRRLSKPVLHRSCGVVLGRRTRSRRLRASSVPTRMPTSRRGGTHYEGSARFPELRSKA